MRIIVCGSRDWEDGDAILEVLRQFVRTWPNEEDMVVVQGGARGADTLALRKARRLGLATETFQADWKTHGKSAGPKRNRQMLDAGADFVLAFKDNFDYARMRGGTEGMMRIATLIATCACFVVQHEDPDTTSELYFTAIGEFHLAHYQHQRKRLSGWLTNVNGI